MPKEHFVKHVGFLKEKKLYPSIYKIDGPSSNPLVKINGEEYLTFSSNNYLGLAGDASIKDSVIEAVRRYGIGSGSTRLLSGSISLTGISI
ncbi:MAG: hypothetical protein AAB590_02865 [Patescibacteria group bacterium]